MHQSRSAELRRKTLMNSMLYFCNRHFLHKLAGEAWYRLPSERHRYRYYVTGSTADCPGHQLILSGVKIGSDVEAPDFESNDNGRDN